MSRRPPNPRRLHPHHHTRRRARAATRRRRWNTPICLLFGFLLTCGRSTAVLANLFHGRHTEFARALRRALGGRVFSLRVKGHEQNIVLLATKGPTRPSDEATMRARLAHAAHASRGGAVDGPMAATMESNAATVGIVDDV